MASMIDYLPLLKKVKIKARMILLMSKSADGENGLLQSVGISQSKDRWFPVEREHNEPRLRECLRLL
jgi:hypothetical protein